MEFGALFEAWVHVRSFEGVLHVQDTLVLVRARGELLLAAGKRQRGDEE